MTDSTDEAELAARVRRMFDEVLNHRRIDAIDEFIAENIVDHSPAPGQLPGRTGIAQMVRILLDTNPELRVLVDDVIVEEHRAAVRETWHTINGMQRIAHFFSFVDGRIVEEWSMGWGDPPTPPQQESTAAS